MDDGMLALCNAAVVLTAVIIAVASRGRTAAVVLLAGSLFALIANLWRHD
jgi:hypothetical protein